MKDKAEMLTASQIADQRQAVDAQADELRVRREGLVRAAAVGVDEADGAALDEIGRVDVRLGVLATRSALLTDAERAARLAEGLRAYRECLAARLAASDARGLAEQAYLTTKARVARELADADRRQLAASEEADQARRDANRFVGRTATACGLEGDELLAFVDALLVEIQAVNAEPAFAVFAPPVFGWVERELPKLRAAVAAAAR